MEVSWDQLDNMRQPVLSDWCDHIDRDLILNVLSVPRIRDLSGLDSSLVSSLWVDEGFVLLLLISWLDHRDNSIWALTDDILFATFLDVFEFDPCKQNKFVNEGTCVFRKKSSNCASYFNISQLPKLSPSGWRNDEGDFIDIDVGFYPQLNFTVAKYNKTYSRDDRIWGYCYQSQGDVLIPAWYGYGKIKWYKNSVPISSGYVMLIRDIHN